MKNLLFLLCVVTATLLTADFAEAGGGSKGTVRLRNNAGSQPVRVWVLTEAEVASLTGAETKAELRSRFGSGVNLNANKHHNFSRRPGRYYAVAYQTSAFDPLPNSAVPLVVGNLGFAQTGILVSRGSRYRVDFNAVIDAHATRTTTFDGPTPY